MGMVYYVKQGASSKRIQPNLVKKYAKSGHTVEDSIDRHIDFDQWKCGQRVSYFFLSFLQSLLFSTPFFYRDSARSRLYSNFNQVKLLEFYS